MDKNDPYFCSELVALHIPEAALVANLESIHAQGCTVSAEVPVVVGSMIAMHCLDCPSGHSNCRNCRFEGRIRSVQQDELGALLEVEFAGRHWDPVSWRPRHMTHLTGGLCDA